MKEAFGMSDQQLVARIKRWFDVRVVDDPAYCLRSNDNNYRPSDVALGMRLVDGSIVDLTSGRTIRGS